MRLKTFLLIVITVFLNISGYCQKKSDKAHSLKNVKPIPDSVITVPEDFDYTLDYMLNSWMVQKASRPDCQPDSDPRVVSDSIYRLRLMKMPCLMEMPYNAAVRSFIDLYTVRKRKLMSFMLGMSQFYFPVFEQVLAANKLPLELKYLPIIESALNTTIVSRMGAAGLWQLMVGTGRLYGLEINSLVDERLNPAKATNAAAHFLKDLYSIYGDWNLVIASYNCGPGNVNKAIRRSGGKRDFWEIYPFLPRETRSYVPVFIAANYSFYYAREHNLCPAVLTMPALTDTIMVHQRIHLLQVAEVLKIPIEEVRLLNPQYIRDIVPGDIKPYSLCLPVSFVGVFINKINEIVAYKADSLINNRRREIQPTLMSAYSREPEARIVYHKVRKGETLSQIAARYGVPLTKLRRWNNIKGSRIKPGERLRILK